MKCATEEESVEMIKVTRNAGGDNFVSIVPAKNTRNKQKYKSVLLKKQQQQKKPKQS